MKLEKLACNSCGAPLEVPESANFVTCNHCSTQLAVSRNDVLAVTEEANCRAEQAQEIGDRLRPLSIDDEVAALDREWKNNREELCHSCWRTSGGRPSKVIAVSAGLFGILSVLVLWWSLSQVSRLVPSSESEMRHGFGGKVNRRTIAPSDDQDEVSSVVKAAAAVGGCGLLLFCAGFCVAEWKQATIYDDVERDYRMRRKKLRLQRDTKAHDIPARSVDELPG